MSTYEGRHAYALLTISPTSLDDEYPAPSLEKILQFPPACSWTAVMFRALCRKMLVSAAMPPHCTVGKSALSSAFAPYLQHIYMHYTARATRNMSRQAKSPPTLLRLQAQARSSHDIFHVGKASVGELHAAGHVSELHDSASQFGGGKGLQQE